MYKYKILPKQNNHNIKHTCYTDKQDIGSIFYDFLNNL